MSPADLSTPTAALVAGLVTSFHCAGMCGPLACTACPGGGPSGWRDGLLYHASRIGSYSLLGGLLGWSGASLGEALGWPVWHFLPWAFLVLFAATALSWDPARFARLPSFLRAPLARAASLRGPRGALLLGLGTPLLPCGPLYLAAGVAATTGSARLGATLMACFGLGTVALIELLRSQMGALRGRFSPLTIRRIQQGLALAACLLLVVRLVWPAFAPAEKPCPLCP